MSYVPDSSDIPITSFDQDYGLTTPQQSPVPSNPSTPLSTGDTPSGANADVDADAASAGSIQSQTTAQLMNGALASQGFFLGPSVAFGGAGDANALDQNNINLGNGQSTSVSQLLGYSPGDMSNASNGSGGAASNFLTNFLSGVSPDQWMKTVGGALSGLETAKLANRALNIQQQNANDQTTLANLKAQQQANEESASGFNLGILGQNMKKQAQS